MRDDDFAEWVEAGWLRPYDDLPGVDIDESDIFAYNLEAMSYRGRRYGLPYYADFAIWVYNRDMLEAAGFEQPPQTLDELTEQAIKVKEAGLVAPDGARVDYPIVLYFRQGPTGFSHWWALNFASEVELFDDEYNPIFPDDEGRGAERILQWLADGVNKHRIIDPNSLTVGSMRASVAAGRQVYGIIDKYDLEWINNRHNSAVVQAHMDRRGMRDQTYAKVVQIGTIPSLEPGQQGTLGWTRMYCLTAHCRPEKLVDAWALMKFLGYKDPAGDYYTARRWFELRGLGFAFKSLLRDPQIIAQTEAWGDIKKIEALAPHARARTNIKAPWFADFTLYYQAEIQKVLLGSLSPRDALGRINERCRQLKREWT
ncbi:MAG: extracellular solute-binding protein [Candidatus Latescibacteria bacterium]|nr:extracellular solute-binding protein [Candidatus Latescibacterota bacterium]